MDKKDTTTGVVPPAEKAQQSPQQKPPTSDKSTDELSPEDLKLRQDLDAHVAQVLSFTDHVLSDEQSAQQLVAINAICAEMRSATTTMTALPKPLKFLREHIQPLRLYYEERILRAFANKTALADLLSVLSTVVSEEGVILRFRIEAIGEDFNSFDIASVTAWGQSYVRTLCGEIGQEYNRIVYQQLETNDSSDQNDDADDLDQGDNQARGKRTKRQDNLSDIDDDDDDEDDELLDDTDIYNEELDQEVRDALVARRDKKIAKQQAQAAVAKISQPTTAMNDDITGAAAAATTTTSTTATDVSATDAKPTTGATATANAEKTSATEKKKKELTNEEKAQLNAEALERAKSKPSIIPPVTDASLLQLRTLGQRLLPFLFAHGLEIDAIDMLFETNNLDAVASFIDKDNFEDVLLYVEHTLQMETEVVLVQRVLLLLVRVYLRLKQYSYALTAALRIAPYTCQKRAIARIFWAVRQDTTSVASPILLQLAYILSQGSNDVAYLCSEDADEDFQDEANHVGDDAILAEMTFPIVENSRAVDILQRGHCGVLDTTTLNDLGVTKPRDRDDVCRAGTETEQAAEWFAVGLANCGTRLRSALRHDSNAKNTSTATTDDDSAVIISGNADVILAKALATGSIQIGDVEEGYSLVDPYLNAEIANTESDAKNKQEKALIGGIIATALCGAGVSNDMNATLALLSEFISETDRSADVHQATCYALGLSYLGSYNGEVRDLLLPIVMDGEYDEDVRAFAALSLALTFAGSCDATILSILVASLEEIEKGPNQRIICVACGLLVLNAQFLPQEFTEIFSSIEAPTLSLLKPYLAVVLDACAHVGSGNMLLVQSLLGELSEYDVTLDDAAQRAQEAEDDEDNDASSAGKSPTTAGPLKQPLGPKNPLQTRFTTSLPGAASPALGPASGRAAAAATSTSAVLSPASKREEINMKRVTRSLRVLAIALTSLSDDLSKQLCQRLLYHLLECGGEEIRSAVPLALGILNASCPTPGLTDQLVRLTHDITSSVAINSTFALGLAAAGSNNSRSLAGVTGMIADTRDHVVTRIGRISQGLCMLGQGTLTLAPRYLNNMCLHVHNIIAILLLTTQMIEPEHGLCPAKLWYWSIIPACVRPKVMSVLQVEAAAEQEGDDDQEPQPLKIPVKIGNVLGGSFIGRKSILSGVQVTTTPLAIAVGQHVQLDDTDYTALTHCFEGTVLVAESKMDQE